MKKPIVTRLQNIDRRIIYALSLLSIIIPLIVPLGLPVSISPTTRAVYNAIAAIPPGSDVLIVFDSSAGINVELAPQTTAVVNHIASMPVKIYIVAFEREEGPVLFESTIRPKVDWHDKKYGVDYVDLGFFAGAEVSMAAFASDVQKLVKKDYFGTPIESLPMMKDIKTLRDFAFVYFCGTFSIQWVLRQFYAPYKSKIGAGTVATQYPEYVAYVSSGQLVGLLNGMTGTAEYELLINKPGLGIASSDASSIFHVMIISLIVLGNVVYLGAVKRKGT